MASAVHSVDVDMRAPYDWVSAPADADFVAQPPETANAAYALLRACMGRAGVAGPEFAEMIPGAADGYCIAFVFTRAAELNAVQIRAVFSQGLGGTVEMQFRERRVRLGESLLAVARRGGAQSIVSEELSLQTKLALFGTRLVHPGAASRLNEMLEAERRFFNARAVALCKGIHRRSKDRAAIFVLSSALLREIFRLSVAE